MIRTLVVWPIEWEGLTSGPESCASSWADMLVPWMHMSGMPWPQDVHHEIRKAGAAFSMLNHTTQWVVIVNTTPSRSGITGSGNKATMDRYRALQDKMNSAMRAVFQIAVQGQQDRHFKRIHIPIFPVDAVAGEFAKDIASMMLQAMITGYSNCASFENRCYKRLKRLPSAPKPRRTRTGFTRTPGTG